MSTEGSTESSAPFLMLGIPFVVNLASEDAIGADTIQEIATRNRVLAKALRAKLSAHPDWLIIAGFILAYATLTHLVKSWFVGRLGVLSKTPCAMSRLAPGHAPACPMPSCDAAVIPLMLSANFQAGRRDRAKRHGSDIVRRR